MRIVHTPSRPIFDVSDHIICDKFVNRLSAGVEELVSEVRVGALLNKLRHYQPTSVGILPQVRYVMWSLICLLIGVDVCFG